MSNGNLSNVPRRTYLKRHTCTYGPPPGLTNQIAHSICQDYDLMYLSLGGSGRVVVS